MTRMYMAEDNGRTHIAEDPIFSISGRAGKAAEEGLDVINGTTGVLLEDDGSYAVMPVISEMIEQLEPYEHTEYAPIQGFDSFKKAITRAALGSFEPEGLTAAVATPGGTSCIRFAVANYAKVGDSVLTTDWYWGPYRNIVEEHCCSLETFRLLNGDMHFDYEDFDRQIKRLLGQKNQDSLLIILNMPGNNPTGYSMDREDWIHAVEVLRDCAGTYTNKRITIIVDCAYIDFAEDGDAARCFLPMFESLPDNVLPIIGYCASKSFAMYGMRCGAAICMTRRPEVAEEFRTACEYSARASWSNPPAAAELVISHLYEDEELVRRSHEERETMRQLMLRRGRAFEASARKIGLRMFPYKGGFFTSVPCDRPQDVCAALEQDGVFLVPMAGGVRTAISSLPEQVCAQLPARIFRAIHLVRSGAFYNQGHTTGQHCAEDCHMLPK